MTHLPILLSNLGMLSAQDVVVKIWAICCANLPTFVSFGMEQVITFENVLYLIYGILSIGSFAS
jgi:hypothetical protein